MAKSYLILCNAIDCSPPGSSVHGILQARVLEWVVPFFSPGALPDPGIEPVSLMSPVLAGRLFFLFSFFFFFFFFFTTSATWEVQLIYFN